MASIKDTLRSLWPDAHVTEQGGTVRCVVGAQALEIEPGWMVFGDPDDDVTMHAALAESGITAPQGFTIHYRDETLARSAAVSLAERLAPVVVDNDHGYIGTGAALLRRIQTDPIWTLDSWK